MAKKELTPIDHKFLESVAEVLTQARKNAKTAVNLSMVYAYFEIGRMIAGGRTAWRESRCIWDTAFKRAISISYKAVRQGLFCRELETHASFLCCVFSGSNWGKQCLPNLKISLSPVMAVNFS